MEPEDPTEFRDTMRLVAFIIIALIAAAILGTLAGWSYIADCSRFFETRLCVGAWWYDLAN